MSSKSQSRWCCGNQRLQNRPTPCVAKKNSRGRQGATSHNQTPIIDGRREVSRALRTLQPREEQEC
eukprot:5471513-Prorocentrum_lima.AAC.1